MKTTPTPESIRRLLESELGQAVYSRLIDLDDYKLAIRHLLAIIEMQAEALEDMVAYYQSLDQVFNIGDCDQMLLAQQALAQSAPYREIKE